MDDLRVEEVRDKFLSYFAKPEDGLKERLQADQSELKQMIAEVDLSGEEQLQSERRDAFMKIAETADNIELLNNLMFYLEKLTNDVEDTIADMPKLSEKSEERLRKMLTKCRNAVGAFLWVQEFFKGINRHAAKEFNLAEQGLQKLQDKLKERRRLQRELALVERKLHRLEMQERRQAEEQKRQRPRK